MRITFVLPYVGLAGGIRVCAIYAERLKRRGHEVTVVSVPRLQPTFKQKVKSVLKGHGWPSVQMGGSSHFDGVDVPHTVLERARPVVSADVPDADVVVATWWETAEWVAALSSSKGAKAYFIQHDERVMVWEPFKPRVAATWHLPMHKITISQWLVDLAREEFADYEVSLVPNSVDTRQFRASARGRQVRPTVGLLYSVTPFKGCDVSLKAFDLVRRKLPNLHLVAYGAHPVHKSLPLPTGSEFYLRPEQSRISELYARCDVWLCGSRAEGFHLPPLEAMACRCPVVSTRVGGAVETVREGENGFLVDVEDSESLADRLLHVLQMAHAQWQKMSDTAYTTAMRYTWDDGAELFEAALCTAIERHRVGQLGHSTPAVVIGE